jgi:thymidine phosphorylase
MDTPLGRAVGNAVEVEESIQALQGNGPEDLMRVTLALAEQMLTLAGLDMDPREALANGAAYEAYKTMIRAQGGDPNAPLPQAPHRQNALIASETGWLTRLDAWQVGVAAWRLGAGRARKEDPVSAAAGIICLAKPGDRVTEGQPILELRADDETRFESAREALDNAITISAQEPEPQPDPVIERIVG